MNKLRQEFCKESGLNSIKPENTEMKQYVIWLEKRIETLSISKVVGQSEQLSCYTCKWLKRTDDYCDTCFKFVKHEKAT